MKGMDQIRFLGTEQAWHCGDLNARLLEYALDPNSRLNTFDHTDTVLGLAGSVTYEPEIDPMDAEE